MSISRPFAYNPGSILSGTTQYGTLAVGIDLTLPYASNYGGIQWWNGPDEELGFCIGTSNPSSDQPTPIGNNGNVGFWRTNGFDDQEFIALANTLTQQNFTNGDEAKLWLNNNGYWTSYDSSVVTPTPTPSITPTITPTVTETPTNTPTPTVTPTETTTPTPTKSIAVTPTPTNALTPSCVNVLSYKQIGNGFSVNDPGYMQLPSGTPFSSATIEYRFNNIDSNGTNAWNIFGNLLSGDTILVESNDFGYNYISYQVVTPPVWNGLHWFIGQVSVLETNTNSRAVFTISSNVTFTINSLCVSPTPSVTPTITPTSSDVPVTPTPTPSTSPVPVTGYGYDLVVLPYNPPASGNTIFPTFASPGLNSGTTNPNTFTTNGVYWNPIDNLGVDRTNYYSGMTGVSVTAYFTQNGDTAIYSGTTTAFTIEGPPGQESFNYNPQARPGQLTLIQSASSDFVTGQTVNISYIVN